MLAGVSSFMVVVPSNTSHWSRLADFVKILTNFCFEFDARYFAFQSVRHKLSTQSNPTTEVSDAHVPRVREVHEV